MFFSPERNNVESYDETYVTKSLAGYNAQRLGDGTVRHPGDRRLLPVQHRYVDSSWTIPTRADYHFVISFDVVPYYIDPARLRLMTKQLSRPQFFITAMNYLPFPGRYFYPWGNGEYEIWGQDGSLQITASTRGGGQYTHKVRSLIDVSWCIQIGWCAVVYLQTADPASHIVRYRVPDMRFTNKSIMANFAVKS